MKTILLSSMNIFTNNKNERLLIELSKDFKSLAHKAGNTSQSVNHLTKVLYTDPDSLVSQVNLISQKVTAIQADSAERDAFIT